MTGYRRIGHPVPGRYAYLAAQLIDAVDGAAFVGTKDEQRGTIGAGHGGGSDDILLPFALKGFREARILPRYAALADCADKHGGRRSCP